jgi:hypothetical protein
MVAGKADDAPGPRRHVAARVGVGDDLVAGVRQRAPGRVAVGEEIEIVGRVHRGQGPGAEAPRRLRLVAGGGERGRQRLGPGRLLGARRQLAAQDEGLGIVGSMRLAVKDRQRHCLSRT